jgi:citrate synthase
MNNIKSGATIKVDKDWNIDFSDGPDAEYIISGQVIVSLIQHIKYLEVVILDCPGSEKSAKELNELKTRVTHLSSEVERLSKELAHG